MNDKLGFGCMRLPLADPDDSTAIDIDELSRMVDAFIGSGFSYFDVAATYHDGYCEQALRRALVDRYPRPAYRLADKLPTMQVDNAARQEQIFDDQLRRCGVDRFDRYMIHCATDEFFARAQALDSFRFVMRKRGEGLVGEAGFSFHGSPVLLERILDEWPGMDFVQLQINYLDWESTPVAARRCYETAMRHGLRVVAMCSQKGGLLADVPAGVESMMRRLRPDDSPSVWALRFVASLEGVDTVLSGMTSLRDVTRNVDTMRDVQPLSADERAVLRRAADAILEAAPVQCTSCGYCVPTCPADIPIPDYLWLYNSQVEARRTGFGDYADRYAFCSEGRGAASACTACGNCERRCPQRLRIIDSLACVAAMFGQPAATP